MLETFYKQPNSRITLLSLHIPTVLEQGYHGAEETLVSQIDWIVGLWYGFFSGFEMCLSPVTWCRRHVYRIKTAPKNCIDDTCFFSFYCLSLEGITFHHLWNIFTSSSVFNLHFNQQCHHFRYHRGSRAFSLWNHRILRGWKGPLRSLSPTANLALQGPPLNHIPKHHMQSFSTRALDNNNLI